MSLTTLKERRERGDLIVIYRLMNNLEKTKQRSNNEKKKDRLENKRRTITSATSTQAITWGVNHQQQSKK